MLDQRGYEIVRPSLPVLAEDGFKSEAPTHDLITAAVHLGDWLVSPPEGLEVDHQGGVAAAKAKRSEATFAECIQGYMEEALPRLRETSRQSFLARRQYFTKTPVSHVRMIEFGAAEIDQWLGWLLKLPTTKNPGRKSFKAELKFLTVILTWYRNYRHPAFVVPIVKRHRVRCIFKSVTPRRPDYYVQPADIRAWILWLKEHRPLVYHRLATFLMLTGARVGEACGLHWDAVDLERRVVRVVRTVSWDHHSRRPTLHDSAKTDESIRLVSLSPDLGALLAEMLEEAEGSGAVFRNAKGELLRYNAIQSAFNAGFKALSLPWRSTHICRHTYATMMLLATKDLSAVQANLGHRSRAITERYAKAVAALDSANAEKTARLIGLGLDGSADHGQNHGLGENGGGEEGGK
jgi:integrase